MKFWITKFALTKGIFVEDNCVVVHCNTRSYASNAENGTFCCIGKDAFETEDEARVNAVKKATRKLKSLQKTQLDIESKLAEWKI